MSNDVKFIRGLLAKAPHEKAPEYVKSRLSIKRTELIGWLQSQSGDWINADVMVSRNGKWYVAVKDWKPQGESQGQRRKSNTAPQSVEDDDEIPF